MSGGLLMQYVVVGLVVLASVLLVFRKLAPKLTNRWLAAASIRCGRPGRSAWVRAFARRLQPKEATGDCSDGCSTCGACGPKRPAAARSGESMPLEFRPRR
ncbi:hypothetical protein RHOFW510R12_03165 [Rhodanobacter sp. FW510-R12]|uniref:DUF6587 family protein n=1 Tax=unclassified Rhodanobacter TaxID=2621553 RepID=UPI0007AA29F7|nr:MULTISPECIES: DUF6587 family protein [unclassified Rhodanobacter]KZC16375.1 hypothetical protein RHOFW104R8_15800 [Rhodanobacter sp. FW104-R8]KZC25418.1 hypothetical protein RhoFW510T8_07740 [Rhodanobacter sp. FW510-T8]KZC31388.1 hypothetical protein RhoFW510R10_16665 [Rhodanobacter sp. FW510-R10]